MIENLDDFIRDNINLKKKYWLHIFSTNCYAYALGLDVNESIIGNYAYQPGYIGGYMYSTMRYPQFTYDSLVRSIYEDLKKYKIDIRRVKPDDEVDIDEWKIALFTKFQSYDFYSNWYSDYHFLRQKDDGLWYHKRGFYRIPTNKDFKRKVIENPKKCNLGKYEYQECFSLKLKKI